MCSYPSGQRKRAVNPLSLGFGGSNPPAHNNDSILDKTEEK